MHRAFLQEDGHWRSTSDLDEVLEHDGQLLVAETRDDVEDCLLEIEAIEGKHTYCNGNTIHVTDEPVTYNITDDMIEGVKAGQEVLMTNGWSRIKTKGQEITVRVASCWEDPKTIAKYDGLVSRKEGEFWRVSYEPDLWASAMKRFKVIQNRRIREAPVHAGHFYDFQRQASVALGITDDKWRIRDTWMVIVAHDAAFGRRATNKLLLPLARKWNKDVKKNEACFSQWVSLSMLKRLSERLAPVTRSGSVSKLES